MFLIILIIGSSNGQNIVVLPSGNVGNLPINLTDGQQIFKTLQQQHQSLSQLQQSNRLIAAKQEPQINQLDGADDQVVESTSKLKIGKKLKKKRIIQLDGGGPGMSDSSSEYDEDEDVDPLQRYAGLEENEKIDPNVRKFNFL